jgi:hypothetical protein
LQRRLLLTGELGTVDAVYTSVLRRAIETAAILRPAHLAASTLRLSATGVSCTPGRARD